MGVMELFATLTSRRTDIHRPDLLAVHVGSDAVGCPVHRIDVIGPIQIIGRIVGAGERCIPVTVDPVGRRYDATISDAF